MVATMNNLTKTMLLLALGVVVLTGAVLGYRALSARYAPEDELNLTLPSETPSGGTSEAPSETPGEARLEAPDFTVYDADGNAVTLSSLEGKPIVLNFWASWCHYCKLEMADFQSAWEDAGDEVRFVMVNATDGSYETQEAAEDYLADEGYTFPVYFDTDGEASNAYGVSGLPTTYFIDADGNVVAGGSGMLTAERLQAGLELIMD